MADTSAQWLDSMTWLMTVGKIVCSSLKGAVCKVCLPLGCKVGRVSIRAWPHNMYCKKKKKKGMCCNPKTEFKISYGCYSKNACHNVYLPFIFSQLKEKVSELFFFICDCGSDCRFFGSNVIYYYFVFNWTESITSTQVTKICEVLENGYQ